MKGGTKKDIISGGLYNTYFKSTNRLLIDNFPEFQLFMETVQQSLNKIFQTEKLKLSNMVQILTAGQKKTQQQYIHSDNILRTGVILLVVLSDYANPTLFLKKTHGQNDIY